MTRFFQVFKVSIFNFFFFFFFVRVFELVDITWKIKIYLSLVFHNVPVTMGISCTYNISIYPIYQLLYFQHLLWPCKLCNSFWKKCFVREYLKRLGSLVSMLEAISINTIGINSWWNSSSNSRFFKKRNNFSKDNYYCLCLKSYILYT